MLFYPNQAVNDVPLPTTAPHRQGKSTTYSAIKAGTTYRIEVDVQSWDTEYVLNRLGARLRPDQSFTVTPHSAEEAVLLATLTECRTTSEG
jgi:hypothetical protein